MVPPITVDPVVVCHAEPLGRHAEDWLRVIRNCHRFLRGQLPLVEQQQPQIVVRPVHIPGSIDFLERKRL